MSYYQTMAITDIHHSSVNLSLNYCTYLSNSQAAFLPQGLSTGLHLIEETWTDLKNEQFQILSLTNKGKCIVRLDIFQNDEFYPNLMNWFALLDLESFQTSQGCCQHKDSAQSGMKVVNKNALCFKY